MAEDRKTVMAEFNATSIDELISIARIIRPHGLRGEVTAEILTDFPDRFTSLSEVLLVQKNQILGIFEIERARFHQDRVILKLAGYDDPTRAEELRGASLVVEPHELAELDENEYFIFDLLECQVFTQDGQLLGRVTKVNDYGAAPLLVVSNETREFLIPLTHEICPEVDIETKKIIVNPPPGLLDL